MKKKILWSIFLSLIILTGCNKEGEKEIVKNLENKIDKTKAYHLKGELEIISNEEKYLYDVDVSYEKEEKYRVSLKNKTNNHEQIILKNEEGVYILTPSLNKSFKFQSEWPYNNSQTYLLKNIVTDLKEEKNREFKETKDGYVFTVGAEYSNNKDLVKQNIYMNKKKQITKVEVLDKKNIVKMTMNIKKIDLKSNYDKDYFTLKDNMKVALEEKEKTVSKNITDIVYPLYMPKNTKLTSQDKVKKDGGERVILHFTGDKEFMLIEETVSISKNHEIIPVSGELELVTDVVGNVSDKEVSWVSGNMEYYLTSSSLSKTELLEIANSISVLPVSK